MNRIPRRVFTEEFKKEAIRLVKSEGLTIVEASRNLEAAYNVYQSLDFSISARYVHRQSRCHTEQLRMRVLERELAIAREERDMLKKAAAYFAKLTK